MINEFLDEDVKVNATEMDIEQCKPNLEPELVEE